MRARVVLVYLACCTIWGSTWVVIATGLRDLPPLLFAGCRMALAGALLLPFAWRELRALAGPPLARLVGVGFLQIAIPYGLMFAAQQWTPSSLTAVLFATFPVWMALLGRALLGEAFTPARAAAVVLGVAGVAVLQAPHLAGLSAEASGRLAAGGSLVVLASITAALANALLKRGVVAASPRALTAGQAASGGAVLLLASLLLERGRPVAFTPRALGAVLYLAVFATVITYLALYWLMPRVPLSVLATIPLLDTTLAVTLGAALLHEPLTWNLAAGGAMVLAAAALAGLPPRVRPPAGGRRGGEVQRFTSPVA